MALVCVNASTLALGLWLYQMIILLMLQKSGEKTTWDVSQNPVNNGRFQLPTSSTGEWINPGFLRPPTSPSPPQGTPGEVRANHIVPLHEAHWLPHLQRDLDERDALQTLPGHPSKRPVYHISLPTGMVDFSGKCRGNIPYMDCYWKWIPTLICHPETFHWFPLLYHLSHRFSDVFPACAGVSQNFMACEIHVGIMRHTRLRLLLPIQQGSSQAAPAWVVPAPCCFPMLHAGTEKCGRLWRLSKSQQNWMNPLESPNLLQQMKNYILKRP